MYQHNNIQFHVSRKRNYKKETTKAEVLAYNLHIKCDNIIDSVRGRLSRILSGVIIEH